METTPTVIAYAPLIAAIVIGIGIIVTLAIVAGKIIFHLGGLFTEVSKMSSSVEGLRTDMSATRTELSSSVEGLRADMSGVRTELSSSVEGLRADMSGVRTELSSSVEGLRTDMSAMRIELRDEIRQSTDRILRLVQSHRHTDTDGSVAFTVPPDGD